MPLQLGLFDIMQVDPSDPDDAAAVYRRRLDDLALADELGFAVAFTAERHFLAHYRCPAPGAWLGAASQRTRRLRLGVLAYTLPLHPPAALAEEIAVLDHLTVGRLEVGLGLGHRPEELAATGLDPAARAAAYRERLAVMRALWSGGRVSLETPQTRVHEVAIHPLPLQEPHPPLWYPGTDPAAAAWAAANGMGLAVGFAPTARLLPAARAYAASRAQRPSGPDAGPANGRIALMRHVYVAEDDARALAEMTDDLVRLNELRAPSGPAGPGSRSDRRAEAATHAATLLRDEVMVAGGPETVAGLILAAGRALGLTLFLANVYAAGVEDARVRRTLRLLAGPVVAYLAADGADNPPRAGGGAGAGGWGPGGP